jgi:hypothetical protein
MTATVPHVERRSAERRGGRSAGIVGEVERFGAVLRCRSSGGSTPCGLLMTEPKVGGPATVLVPAGVAHRWGLDAANVYGAATTR